VKEDSKEASERAVALRYEHDKEDAPRVVAKGRGKVARQIIEIAEEHGVTIYEDDELVEVLSRLDLNQLIPPELYYAIAEVLSLLAE